MQNSSTFAALSHDLIVRLDEGRRILAANPACTRVLGFAEAELVGSALVEFLQRAGEFFGDD